MILVFVIFLAALAAVLFAALASQARYLPARSVGDKPPPSARLLAVEHRRVNDIERVAFALFKSLRPQRPQRLDLCGFAVMFLNVGPCGQYEKTRVGGSGGECNRPPSSDLVKSFIGLLILLFWSIVSLALLNGP